MNFKLYLTNPRGFCAGVDRAIKILDYAVENMQHPIYVKHEVVHNKHVIANFKKKGVKFIEDVSALSNLFIELCTFVTRGQVASKT